MKLNCVLFLLFGLSVVTSYGQINLEDSTVQVIGYWDNGEKQTYVITREKYKVFDADTTAREFLKYEVDISIKDSTANSYTVEWFYRNYEITSTNVSVKKLASIFEGMKVVFKTNEMGAFVEVLNWKELQTNMLNSIKQIKQELKGTPKLDELFLSIEVLFSTKEAIESVAIKDVQQYYTFHGGKYTLGEEATGMIKLPNTYGGEPLDAELVVSLDEINVEEDNAIIRMWQTVNAKQATDAAYLYMQRMAKVSGVKLPSREEMPEVSVEDHTATRVHGPSGWIIYSINTREASAENVLSIEERIIELK